MDDKQPWLVATIKALAYTVTNASNTSHNNDRIYLTGYLDALVAMLKALGVEGVTRDDLADGLLERAREMEAELAIWLKDN